MKDTEPTSLKDWLGSKAAEAVQLPGQMVWVPRWVVDTMTEDEVAEWVRQKREQMDAMKDQGGRA